MVVDAGHRWQSAALDGKHQAVRERARGEGDAPVETVPLEVVEPEVVLLAEDAHELLVALAETAQQLHLASVDEVDEEERLAGGGEHLAGAHSKGSHRALKGHS